VPALPAILLLTGAVVLGLLLGRDYLRRVRSKPALIGFHLLLGAGGIEVTVMLLRGAPSGAAMLVRLLLKAATGFLRYLAWFVGASAALAK
jgi:hypothetical protein